MSVTLPLLFRWFKLAISTSSRFSGITISSTCVDLASLQLGIAGSASSLVGLLGLSNVANCGLSGAELKDGAAWERYCWFRGRVSMGGGAIGAWYGVG